MIQTTQQPDKSYELRSALFEVSAVWIRVLGLCLTVVLGIAPVAAQEQAGRGELPIPTHIEFVSQWFPRSANSSMSADVVRAKRLATRMIGSPSHFASILQTLELIRSHAGFDPTQVERFTTAKINSGVTGTVLFFTLDEAIPIKQHFASGQFPITPKEHRFHNLQIYQLTSADQDLGLYTAEGKHFILGDWAAFKTTLVGNDGRLNELAKILASQAAPLVICSNPRRAGKRHSVDDPFGTVISIDYHEDNLAFMMQEEHPTPAVAASRLLVMENDMPGAFSTAYGLDKESGVQYLAKSDGRHATFALQAPIRGSKKLLTHMLGRAADFDVHAEATKLALKAIDTYEAARAAKLVSGTPASVDRILDSLCVGLEHKGGKRFGLPYLTGVEQDRIAERLELIDGSLRVVEQVVVEIEEPKLDDKQIRRQARLIATLTMSAAAADSQHLKKLNSSQEIVTAICESGFRGGPGYHKEFYKGPDLTLAERARVASFLVPSQGYLIYKSN